MLTMRIIIIILLLSVCQGCLYYNFATKADGKAILYDDCNPYERNGNWQFCTALLDDEKVYTEFRHLSFKHFNKPGHKAHYISLEFTFKEGESARVIPESVSVVVRNMDGKVIPQEVSSNYPNYKSWHFSFKYPKILPKRLIEEVKFSIESDGNIQNYEFNFPVELKLHYTFWSVLMSV